MKQFIRKVTLFVLILFVFVHLKPLYLLHKDRYKRSGAGKEVHYSVYKSKQRNESSIVLLGDSVAYQLFRNTTSNGPINSLACNQAISMVGHFILLHNYLEAGNRVDTVCLLLSPFSLSNNLNQVYTYHYFLKPFYRDEYFPLFTKTVIQQVHKIPYYYLCRYPSIITSNWAPDFAPDDTMTYKFLSPVSAEYLIKIKELAGKYHFKLIFMSTPVRLSGKNQIENMKNEITIDNLKREFEDYFDNILYQDDSEFGNDGVHLKDPKKYMEYYKSTFMKGNDRRLVSPVQQHS